MNACTGDLELLSDESALLQSGGGGLAAQLGCEVTASILDDSQSDVCHKA
jgi:hypothetical protein